MKDPGIQYRVTAVEKGDLWEIIRMHGQKHNIPVLKVASMLKEIAEGLFKYHGVAQVETSDPPFEGVPSADADQSN